MQWYEILGLSLAIWLVVSVILAYVLGRVVGVDRKSRRRDRGVRSS
ncbi:MAG: hypothetical protein ABI990_00005 [Actinomycetota bacterium]